MFECKACSAKDDEIRWLRQQLEQKQRIEAETEKPGILRQVEPKEGREIPTPPEKPQVSKMTFPGYEPAPPDEVEVT
jgi:hypothetical protein